MLRNEIKATLAAHGWTLSDVVRKMNEHRDANNQTTPQNISNKLSRGTLKYTEAQEIAEIIGCDIVWQPKK